MPRKREEKERREKYVSSVTIVFGIPKEVVEKIPKLKIVRIVRPITVMEGEVTEEPSVVPEKAEERVVEAEAARKIDEARRKEIIEKIERVKKVLSAVSSILVATNEFIKKLDQLKEQIAKAESSEEFERLIKEAERVTEYDLKMVGETIRSSAEMLIESYGKYIPSELVLYLRNAARQAYEDAMSGNIDRLLADIQLFLDLRKKALEEAERVLIPKIRKYGERAIKIASMWKPFITPRAESLLRDIKELISRPDLRKADVVAEKIVNKLIEIFEAESDPMVSWLARNYYTDIARDLLSDRNKIRSQYYGRVTLDKIDSALNALESLFREWQQVHGAVAQQVKA